MTEPEIAETELEAPREASPLAKWEISQVEFWLLVALACSSIALFTHAFTLLGNYLFGEEDAVSVVLSATFGMQVSMAFSVLFFRHYVGQAKVVDRSQGKLGKQCLIALKWMLLSYVGMVIVGGAWQAALDFLGFEKVEQEPVKLLMESQNPAQTAFMVTMTISLVPVCEELLFRGAVFRYLHLRLKPFLAVGISAAVFALIHISLYNFAPLMVIGIGLALAYRESGSLVSSIAFHAMFNSIQVFRILADMRFQ